MCPCNRRKLVGEPEHQSREYFETLGFCFGTPDQSQGLSLSSNCVARRPSTSVDFWGIAIHSANDTETFVPMPKEQILLRV